MTVNRNKSLTAAALNLLLAAGFLCLASGTSGLGLTGVITGILILGAYSAVLPFIGAAVIITGIFAYKKVRDGMHINGLLCFFGGAGALAALITNRGHADRFRIIAGLSMSTWLLFIYPMFALLMCANC